MEVGLILQKYVLQQQLPFSGSFGNQCVGELVAKPPLTLVDVLLEGSSFIAKEGIEDPSNTSARIRVACTISQQRLKIFKHSPQSLSKERQRDTFSTLLWTATSCK